MIKVENIISKSFIAGLVVCIGCYFYLSMNSLLGQILLSSSLLYIIIDDLNLFTSKSGFMSASVDFRRLFLILLLNLLTAFSLGILMKYVDHNLAILSDNALKFHLDCNFFSLIIKSIVAGFIMTLTVRFSVRHPNHYILPMLCILGFIITDCPHFITEMFYYGASNLLVDNLGSSLLQILIIIIFNFLGCNLYNLIMHRSFMHIEE